LPKAIHLLRVVIEEVAVNGNQCAIFRLNIFHINQWPASFPEAVVARGRPFLYEQRTAFRQPEINNSVP